MARPVLPGHVEVPRDADQGFLEGQEVRNRGVDGGQAGGSDLKIFGQSATQFIRGRMFYIVNFGQERESKKKRVREG